MKRGGGRDRLAIQLRFAWEKAEKDGTRIVINITDLGHVTSRSAWPILFRGGGKNSSSVPNSKKSCNQGGRSERKSSSFSSRQDRA